MSLTIEVAGKSDIGCVRTNNEDNFGYDSRLGIYVVCDGMGGQAAGEVASKIAVETILGYFQKAAKSGSFEQIGTPADDVSDRANSLGSAVTLANTAIFEAASSQEGRKGMGSTIVSVLVEGRSFSIANVGDSRIYLFRDGGMQQITEDHSLVMEQVRRGYITVEQARKSEVQNVILRALGQEATVKVDLADKQAKAGDMLLLCTDGLTHHVSDERLLQIVNGAESLQEVCDVMVQAARDEGGKDNITCLLLGFVDTPPWYRAILGKILPETVK